jgi:hypothetical protein
MDLERDRALLRHMLATIAYRGGKTLRNAPAGFADFRAPGVFNSPGLLLAHIGDLIEWAHRWTITGDPKSYQVAQPLPWDEEIQRFHALLSAFDADLEAGKPLHAPLETLFQSALADALTHIGQMALLRRLAGDPIAGESYRQSKIEAGRVGEDQAAAVREFERDKGALWQG